MTVLDVKVYEGSQEYIDNKKNSILAHPEK